VAAPGVALTNRGAKVAKSSVSIDGSGSATPTGRAQTGGEDQTSIASPRSSNSRDAPLTDFDAELDPVSRCDVQKHDGGERC
jgi:hypothetical protein